MLLKLILILFALNILFVNCFMDTDLVLSFFKKKYLKYNTILTCFNKKAQVHLAKKFIEEKDVLVSVKTIKVLNILDTIVTKYRRVGIVLDGDCVDAKSLLLKCRKYKCFDSKHFWLVLYNSSDYYQLLKNSPLNIESEVNVAYPNDHLNSSNPCDYIINDVYNPAYERGGNLKTSEVGFYSRKRGYNVKQFQNKYLVRKNLTGVTFKTVVVLPEPFDGILEDYLLSDKDIVKNTFNRFHTRLMYYCRDYYNFSMDISLDKSWGYLQSDGTMDGLVGDLERHKIDYGLSPLFVKSDRAKFISYGRRTWILRAAFIFRNPKSRKSYQLFIKPLSIQVWVCILMSSVISVFIQKFSYGLDKKVSRTANVESTWSYTTVCTVGAFCQQGIIANPRSLCGRITAIFTLLLGSLVYQFYSASLVSFLLNVPTTVITSVQEILDHNFKVGCEDVLYDKDFLMYSTDNVTRELYRRLLVFSRNNTGFLKPEEGLQKVKKGGYAYHVELATGYPIIQQTFNEWTICDLKEVPMFGVKAMHANYQKNSPFKDVIDICLHRLSENGVLNREILFWHPKKPECMRSGPTFRINTGLEDFYPALFVLIIGIILSFQILIIEILWHYRASRKMAVKQTLFPFLN